MNLNEAAHNMLLLRYRQHVLNEFLKKRRFKIPIHLAFGHEAIAVALSSVSELEDSLCVTHRNVAFNLARQKAFKPILDLYDLIGSEEMASMGSMNLALKENGVDYASSILGNNLAVAAGVAMNRKLSSRPGITFAVTGDGAIEEGVFWEVLLHARSQNLPLVILVEDNDYSLASTTSQRRCAIDLQLVCKGVGVEFHKVNGASYVDMEQALHLAREEAASGRPVCVSARVKTFCQHAGPTPGWPTDPLNIDITNGMILEEDFQDPLFDMQLLIGKAIFQEIEDQVVSDERSS